MLFENSTKVSGIRKAASDTNFGNGDITVQEQMLGFAEAAIGEVLCRSYVKGVLKNTTQMLWGNICQLC